MVECGVAIGDEIRKPLIPFLRGEIGDFGAVDLGDVRAEIMEDAREWVLVDLLSLMLIFDGLCLSCFSDDVCGCTCRGPVDTPPGTLGGGILFTSTPAAFASSCSMTWAYKSSRFRFIISLSASTTLLSILG